MSSLVNELEKPTLWSEGEGRWIRTGITEVVCIDSHTEQRMRKHLLKHHKVKDRGIGEGRFPSVDLYRRYGLYKVPTAAGWKSAHALA